MKNILSYKVNNFIELKLKEDKTVIYIAGKEFRLCKSLVIQIPRGLLSEDLEFQSIDDFINSIDNDKTYYNIDDHKIYISPEEEFWVHCSSFEAWVKFNYDTRLMDSQLAFPILRQLAINGDSKAEIIFREEILKRFKHGSYQTQKYLMIEGYLANFTTEELINGLLDPEESIIMSKISGKLNESGYFYDITCDFDDDKVRHRSEAKKLFFTIKDGKIYSLEIFCNRDISKYLNELNVFNKLTRLVIYLSDYKSLNKLSFSYTLNSVKILKIISEDLNYISDDFNKFPNLTHLFITGGIFDNNESLNSLGNLVFLRFDDVYYVDLPMGLIKRVKNIWIDGQKVSPSEFIDLIDVIPEGTDVDFNVLIKKFEAVLPRTCLIEDHEIINVASGLKKARVRVRYPAEWRGTNKVEELFGQVEGIYRVEGGIYSGLCFEKI